MTPKEVIIAKDRKRREIEVAENMIRLAAFEALAPYHKPHKSRIKRDHFHGVDITEIEIENDARKWKLTIKRITGKRLSGGWSTEVFFDFPGINVTDLLRSECEKYSKLVAV